MERDDAASRVILEAPGAIGEFDVRDIMAELARRPLVHQHARQIVDGALSVRQAVHEWRHIDRGWEFHKSIILLRAVKALEVQGEHVGGASHDQGLHGDDQFLARIASVAIVALQRLRQGEMPERRIDRRAFGHLQTEVQKRLRRDAGTLARAAHNAALQDAPENAMNRGAHFILPADGRETATSGNLSTSHAVQKRAHELMRVLLPARAKRAAYQTSMACKSRGCKHASIAGRRMHSFGQGAQFTKRAKLAWRFCDVCVRMAAQQQVC